MRSGKMKNRNGRKLLLIFVTGVMLLAACRIAKPYQLLANADSSKLYRGVANADSSNNIATVSYKEIFSDTLLQHLIEEGINNNLDLKVATARIKTAAANFKQSKLSLLPSVDANVTAGYQRVPSTQFGFPEAYQVYISTSWEADIWGKLGSAKR